MPFKLCRPLLSYDQVGGVLEGMPSSLFDKLQSLLGLQPINDGHARLGALLKKLQIPAAAARAALTELKLLLAGSTDPRAAQASVLVGKRAPDIAAVEQLATGSAPEVGGTLDTLKVLGRVTWPEQAEVDDAAGELRTAVADLAAQASSAADVFASRSRLLSQALELHQTSGDIDLLVAARRGSVMRACQPSISGCRPVPDARHPRATATHACATAPIAPLPGAAARPGPTTSSRWCPGRRRE